MGKDAHLGAMIGPTTGSWQPAARLHLPNHDTRAAHAARARLPDDFAVGGDGDQIDHAHRFVFLGAQVHAEAADVVIGH